MIEVFFYDINGTSISKNVPDLIDILRSRDDSYENTLNTTLNGFKLITLLNKTTKQTLVFSPEQNDADELRGPYTIGDVFILHYGEINKVILMISHVDVMLPVMVDINTTANYLKQLLYIYQTNEECVIIYMINDKILNLGNTYQYYVHFINLLSGIKNIQLV